MNLGDKQVTLRGALEAAVIVAERPDQLDPMDWQEARKLALLACEMFGLSVVWDDALIGQQDESLMRPENRQYVDGLHWVYRVITLQTPVDEALARISEEEIVK